MDIPQHPRHLRRQTPVGIGGIAPDEDAVIVLPHLQQAAGRLHCLGLVASGILTLAIQQDCILGDGLPSPVPVHGGIEGDVVA